MDRVSICSATHNHRRFLAGWLQSIISQLDSLEDCEIEIILAIDEANGGESIETDLILLNEFSKYPDSCPVHIKTIVNEHNMGCSYSITRALSLATGSYIGILETDDFYNPTKLSKSIAYMNKNNLGGLHTDITAIYPNGGKENKWWLLHGVKQQPIVTLDRLKQSNTIYTCSFLARAEWFSSIPTPLEISNKFGMLVDYPMFLTMVSKGCKIGYIDESLSTYRADIGINTTRRGESIQQDIKVRDWAHRGCMW